MNRLEILEQTFTEEIYKFPARVYILIPVEWSTLKPSEIELLTKILNAVNLNINEVTITSRKAVDLNELMVCSPDAVIAFGTEIIQVTSMYTVEKWNDIPILKASLLATLSESEKSKLWASLKQIFAQG